jgi:CMP-N-acetylneuraminic acid synthetase
VYKARKILAVIPARGGSKGLPLKNLRKLMGLPLVGLAGQVAHAVPIIDRIVVSTDHEEIARVALQFGIDAPFRRPTEISGDLVSDVEVLTHALQATEAIDSQFYDIIAMLQPTSPLRKPEHVMTTIKKCVDETFDAVWTVSPTDSKAHPLKQLRCAEGEISLYDPAGAEVIARQQLSTVYHRNGAAYAMTRDCLLHQKTLLGKRTGAVVLQGHHISVDTEWALQLLEYILAHQSNLD